MDNQLSNINADCQDLAINPEQGIDGTLRERNEKLKKRLRIELFCFAILLSIFFIILAHDVRGSDETITWSIILLSIGCSFFAALAYAYLYQSKLDELNNEDFTDKVEVALKRASTNSEKFSSNLHITTFNSIVKEELAKFTLLVDSLRDIDDKICPRHMFEESNTPLTEYSLLVDNDFNRITNYRYKGITGPFFQLYKIRKILPKPKQSLTIQLLLLDPLDDCAYEHYSRWYGQSIYDLRIKLFAFLASLLRNKDMYQIEIYFYSELSSLRYEITDNILLLSFITEQKQNFPLTLLYGKNSVFYDPLLSNFNCLVDKAKNNLDKSWRNGDLTEKNILSLAKSSGVNVTIEELLFLNSNYESKYKTYL